MSMFLFVFKHFQNMVHSSVHESFGKSSAQVWSEHWFDHQPNDETAQQQKSGGRGRKESFGETLRGGGEEEKIRLK